MEKRGRDRWRTLISKLYAVLIRISVERRYSRSCPQKYDSIFRRPSTYLRELVKTFGTRLTVYKLHEGKKSGGLLAPFSLLFSPFLLFSCSFLYPCTISISSHLLRYFLSLSLSLSLSLLLCLSLIFDGRYGVFSSEFHGPASNISAVPIAF